MHTFAPRKQVICGVVLTMSIDYSRPPSAVNDPSVASSFEVILARPSRHSTTGTSSSGTSGSRCIFHSAAWKISEKNSAVSFLHAFSYRVGNCNCLLSHIARWLPTANNLQEFFVHAVLFPDS